MHGCVLMLCADAAGWRDSVCLAHQPSPYIPDCQATPKDIEEKEKSRCAGNAGLAPEGTCQPID
jgi:hypothetical protein